VCAAGFATGAAESGYTIVRLDTRRGDRWLAPVEFHLARAPETGRLRIIGVNRR
jgi:hypothetical protein